MKREDLIPLRESLTAIDKNDKVALRKWFDAHPHLTVNDIAQILERSAQIARRLRIKAGIVPKSKAKPPPPNNLPETDIEVPENWRTKEWLGRAIKLYSLNRIAKAVQRDRNIVRGLLKKFDIPWKKTAKEATKSKNPCCTHAWCYQQYITLKQTQEKCAELAGIARQTFILWLNRFEIPVRDATQTEQGRVNTTTWEQELVYKLKQQPIVRVVKQREGYIHVRYRNYFWENYYTKITGKKKRPYTFFPITPETAVIKKVPLVYPEYGVDVEGKAYFPAHIAISRRDLNNASLMEQRVALHEFARHIVTRGWIWPSFPDDVLEEDMGRVKDFNIAKYLENGGFTSIPRNVDHPPGRRIMLHYFDFSRFHNLLKCPSYLVRLLNILVDTSKDFNLFNLIMSSAAYEGTMFMKERKVCQIPDPVVYLAIMKRLGLTGTVMDLSVGLGNRAIACAAAGLKYTTPDPAFQGAIDRGFLEFSGLDYVPYDGQNVDILLYDEGFAAPQMEKVVPYLGKTKKLLVFAPPSHKEEVLKYNPTSAIRVRTRFYNKTPGFLFVW